jgi:hypothetical protein
MLKTRTVFVARIMNPPRHSRPLANNPCPATYHCCVTKVRTFEPLFKDRAVPDCV